MRRLIDAPHSDIFDVLAYVRFTLAPLTRSERADAAKTTGLRSYQPEMREFLDYVLHAYESQGIADALNYRRLLRIRYGGTNDAKRRFGPVPDHPGRFFRHPTHLFR